MLPGFGTKPASSASSSTGFGRMPEFLRRAVSRDQMEMDSALTQMWYLLTQPTLVSKISKARKMTKNHYHRDDPAFIVLQLFFIAVVTVAFGLALQAPFLRIVYTTLFSCALSYGFATAIVSGLTWLLCNRVLVAPQASPHEVRREVEWQYCVDVHCNAYFAFFIYADVAHLALLPFTVRSSFLAQLLANALFAAGAVAYCYVTFRGFVELPNVDRPQVFLYPVFGIVTLFVLATITTHINMSHAMLHHSWPLEA
jgi:hypothetical protein